MPDILDRLLKSALHFRSSLENPSTPLSNPDQWLYDALGAGGTVASGVRVNPQTALGLTAFWACVKIISETVGSLPLHVYRQLDDDGDKEKATDRTEYGMLHDEFNPVMTSMVARETGQGHVLCWGNSYFLIRYNGASKTESLWPLLPSKTRATTTAGQLVYETSDTPNGKLVEYAYEDVVHVPGFGFDGICGLSPVRIHRETIGHGIATEKYGSAFFGRGERPAGVLEHPATLTDDAHANLQKSLESLRSDTKPHGTLILEEGMKYHTISVPPDDAQYIETRQFNVSDMARIFRIPLSMLEVHDRSAAYASVEQFFLQFAVHTIRPWLVRWEQELNRKVLGLKSGLCAEFDLNALLRGDIKSRFEAYQIALNNHFMNSDEVRAKENMNKMPDKEGEVFFVPSTMVTLDRAIHPPAPQPPATAQSGAQSEPPPQQARTESGPNGKEVTEVVQ
jgi:HK97 family phage portal protein